MNHTYISLFPGDMGRGLRGLLDTRILARTTDSGAVAQGRGCPFSMACTVCHPHLGSGDQHSPRQGGTARCLASSGWEEAASPNSSAHRRCSYFYSHTCVCPVWRENEEGQAKYLTGIKVVLQVMFWTAGKMSLGVTSNRQTEKLLLTAVIQKPANCHTDICSFKRNIYACT